MKKKELVALLEDTIMSCLLKFNREVEKKRPTVNPQCSNCRFSVSVIEDRGGMRWNYTECRHTSNRSIVSSWDCCGDHKPIAQEMEHV